MAAKYAIITALAVLCVAVNLVWLIIRPECMTIETTDTMLRIVTLIDRIIIFTELFVLTFCVCSMIMDWMGKNEKKS